MQIGIVGIGKLGLPLASLFAQAGHRITCVDIDQNKIEMINKHQNPIPAEPDIVIPQNMTATSDYGKLYDCEIIFITVNTPPLPQGNLRLDDLTTACQLCAIHASKDAIIVISSTVPPNTMHEHVKPILEGKVQGIVYNPFFIALGQVVKDLQFPDIVLIGGDDISTRWRLAGLWAGIIGSTFPICETNLKTAELVKFSSNPYLVMRINWANTVARLAEALGDVDAQEVIDIIGKDKRANTKNLHAGLPWGGDCFPKDIDAVTYFCNTEGIDGLFFEDLAAVNQNWKEILPKIIKDKVCRSDFRKVKIAFLGISYKKSYPLLSKSTAYELYEYFVRDEANVYVHDPYIEELPDGSQTHPLAECLKDAELVIVAVGYSEYAKLTVKDLPSLDVPVVDLCRGLVKSEISAHENWLPLGWRK